MSLEVRNLSKRFGDITAVHDLNFEVTDEDFLVLLGPSGSGKTTTLRMIAGLETPTEGEIISDGEDITYLEPADRDIAMVFQNYALYPHMSVRENIGLSLKVSGIPKDTVNRRVDEVTKVLDIPELTDRKPSELSGGQQQRVALGRAIIRDPSVFLLDEPLSNLDAKLRMQMRKELKELHQRLNTTFVYVTHDQVEAMTMATQIAVLDGGELQQLGSPEELYDEPANEFVAEFIGSPSMNMFEGHVVSRDGTFALEFNEFTYHLDERLATLVSEYEGRAITMGIRPESIQLDEAGRFEATVNVVEPMGAEELAYIEWNNMEINIQTERNGRLERNRSITFDIPQDRIHLFVDEQAIA